MTPSTAPARVTGWRITGLFWDEHEPCLVASHPDRADRSLPLPRGQELRLALTGPRACVGLWDQRQGRRLCERPLPAGTNSQCPACAEQDRGKQLARDAYVDERTYLLYLAWFGPELVKVGMTAAERGRARLLEQGALWSVTLAQGPLTAVREAERAIRRAALATEQVRLTRKLTALERLDEAARDQAGDDLSRVRERALQSGLLDRVQVLSDQVQDHTAVFSLTVPTPLAPFHHRLDPAAPLEGARLVGQVRAVWGRVLIVDLPGRPEPLVADARLLSGYRLGPAPTAPHALPTRAHTPDTGETHDQIGLF
ncbi:DUF2797 domain-containing protein [Nocardiopsis sp. NPDC006198]|uniref:DUF2797 domain-containing protein n=1 Tax=Nocardiopsis sp. NPDC006198 TaxID=3154472 RepID=UPI0033A33589